jgi:hypothetical protein
MYDWKMTRKDEELVRFGLFWKMDDLVLVWILVYQYFIQR